MTNPEQELLDTIEKLRQEKFSDLPADLVQRIVEIERDFTENRQEAFKRITKARKVGGGKETPGCVDRERQHNCRLGHPRCRTSNARPNLRADAG